MKINSKNKKNRTESLIENIPFLVLIVTLLLGLCIAHFSKTEERPLRAMPPHSQEK